MGRKFKMPTQRLGHRPVSLPLRSVSLLGANGPDSARDAIRGLGQGLDFHNSSTNSCLQLTLLFAFGILVSLASVAANATNTPESFTYQGRITRPDSQPMENNNVRLSVQILSGEASGQECLPYQKSHLVDMSWSGDRFSLSVGSAPPSLTLYILTQIFSNDQSFTGLSCSDADTSYSPNPDDQQKVRLMLDEDDDTYDVQSVSSDLTVGSVPFLLIASNFQGKAPGQFIQMNEAAPVRFLSASNHESDANCDIYSLCLSRAIKEINFGRVI